MGYATTLPSLRDCSPCGIESHKYICPTWDERGSFALEILY